LDLAVTEIKLTNRVTDGWVPPPLEGVWDWRWSRYANHLLPYSRVASLHMQQLSLDHFPSAIFMKLVNRQAHTVIPLLCTQAINWKALEKGSSGTVQ